MRPNGLIERVTDSDSHQKVMDYQLEGFTEEVPVIDFIELHRIITLSFLLYQSTHTILDAAVGTLFPYAWKLESGDKVYNYDRDEYYTIKYPEKIHRPVHSHEQTDFPDLEELKFHTKKNTLYDGSSRYPKYEPVAYRLGLTPSPYSTGEVGYIVTLVNSEGAEVRPSESDVLLFQSDRYIQFAKAERAHHLGDYIPDPEDDSYAVNIDKGAMPIIIHGLKRMEPGSRDTRTFGALKQAKSRPRSTITDPNEPNIAYQLFGMPLELTSKWKLITATKYDAEIFLTYVMRFLERHAAIWNYNGIEGVTHWQTLPLAATTKTDMMGYALDVYFRVHHLEMKAVTKRRDVFTRGYVASGPRQDATVGQSDPVN